MFRRADRIAACVVAGSLLLATRDPLLGGPDSSRADPARQAAYAAPAELTPAQLRQSRRLLGTFRKSRRDPQQRAAAAATLLEWGPAGANLLLSVVEEELRPKLERYRAAFSSAAAEMIAGSPAQPAELAMLRQRIRQVSQLPELTEQIIREQSEPAVNRLAQLLLVDRAKVVQRSPKLLEQRAAMAELGSYWEQCQRLLAGTEVAADGATEGPIAAPAVSFEGYLTGEEELAVQLAMPMSDGDRAVLQANARLVGGLDSEEARGILALNLLRMMSGLNPLAIDPALCQTARDHSHDMRTISFFSHTSPVPGKESFVDRAARFNAKASAENIARGPVEGMASLKMWYFSPGHHKNLLGDARRIGLGRSGTYWTQLFGR